MSESNDTSGGPKRHHYVARSYLERFSNDRRQVTVYDRTKERDPYTTSILNAAVISGLYDIVDAEGNKDKSAEAALSQLEGDAIRVLKQIDDGKWDKEALPDAERQVLALYMAVQFTRTPEHRFQKRVLGDLHFRLQADLNYQKYGREGITSWLREIYGREPAADEVNSAISLAERITEFQVFPNNNQFVVDLFEDAAEAAAFLDIRSWKLIRARRDRFLTSDRPVTPWRKRSRGNRHLGVGLANADYIYFPLDPRQVIVMESSDSPSWTVRTVTEADIGRINERVAHWSTRYVYHRPNHRLMESLSLSPEGPILHINGIPVGEGSNIWNRLRQNFLDGTTLPVIHAGFGVDSRAEETSTKHNKRRIRGKP